MRVDFVFKISLRNNVSVAGWSCELQSCNHINLCEDMYSLSDNHVFEVLPHPGVDLVALTNAPV